MANARAVIDIDINTSGAAAALKSLQGQINAFSTALNRNNAEQALASKGMSRQLMELVNTSRFFSAEMTKMQTGAAQLDKTLSKGQVTMGQFFSQKFRKDGLAAAQVLSLANARASALQTQFIATAGAANGMREAIAIRPLQAFNTEAAVTAQRLAIQRAMLQQATTSMINFGKNTQWAGRQLMVGFTVPMTIFAATAGKAFMEIDKELTNFKKVYGDAMTPPAEIEENIAAIQGLAKEFTKYGIAVKDTIGLAAQAAAAGAQNQDLIDATTQSTRLATLGQMEQNEALETTIALQNAFKLSGQDLADSINFLNMVENQTVVTLQDLSAAIPRVAPVIKGLGGSVEDLAAMLAAMQEGGVTAEQGANALKSGLASLINPTDRATEKLSQLGINLNAIIQTNRGDLMATIQDFADALDTVDKFSRQQALEQVFGKFQYARLGALFDNINKDGTQASRVLDLATMSTQQLAASAEKELSAVEQSVSVRFTAAMEKIKAEIAPIGELFLKMATPVINFLSAIIEKFNSLPDFVKSFAAFGTVIVGVVIPAGTMFLGLLMNLVGTLTKFGHLSTIFIKGFASGGIRKAIENVTQAVSYMSLSEIDASLAAQQLGSATMAVNAALLDQVDASQPATAAIMELAGAYDILAQNMRESALAAPVALGLPGQAMRRGSGSLVGRPLPIVARNKGGSIPYMSDGGRRTVPGLGNKDTVPAMLTPGEFVVNKKATQQNLGLLHAINDGDVQYRNMGGGIAEYGREFYGIRPSPFAAQAQKARERLEQFERERTAVASGFGISSRIATSRQRATSQSQIAAVGKKSEEIYSAMAGRGTKASQLLKVAVERLGISPQGLRLKTVGNLVLDMSPSTNMGMANGNLTKQQLLGELGSMQAYSPLAAQIKRYFGRKFDNNLFDSVYREEVSKLPDFGITNKTFEKATRNALVRYFKQAGYSREERKSFIKDILTGDTVRTGMTKDEVISALSRNGIQFEERGRDIYGIVDGVQYNFSDLTGRSIDSLGRVEGLERYDKLRVREGMARVHANKGGMIPGVQYFGKNMLRRIVMPASIVQKMTSGIATATRGAPYLFRKLKSQLGEEVDSRILMDAMRVGGYSKKPVMPQWYNRIATAHINPEKRDGLKLWRARNIRYTTAAENHILNQLFSNVSKEKLDFIEDVARNNNLVRFFRSMKSGKHPTSAAEYEKLDKLITALRRDKRFSKIFSGPYDDADTALLLGLAKFRHDKSKAIAEYTSQYDDPFNLVTGRARTAQSIIQQKNSGGFISPTLMANQGNIVPGMGNKDTVPAMLTPGEFVINKKATMDNLGLLHAINGGQIKGYALGGLVEEGTDINGKKIYRDQNGNLVYGNRRPVPSERVPSPPPSRNQSDDDSRGRRGGMMGGMGRGMGLSMGIGMAGGALMSTQMIPGVAENPQLSGIAQAGGMALSLGSILPMIPGAMNPYVLAVGAAAAVTAGALYAWRKSVDENAKKSAELGAAVGGTANSLNVMSRVLGIQTPAMSQAMQSLNVASDQMAQFGDMATYLQGEAGQEFLSRFEGKTTAQRTTELTDYLNQAMASGMMDKQSAELFAKAVGQSLGDYVTGTAVAAKLKTVEAGVDSMMALADKRLAEVEKMGAISEVLSAPEIGTEGFQKSIATDVSAFAIGSSLQIVQDYSNVLAQARTEYENGTISYEKYIDVLNKATNAQDKYAGVISKSVANAVDMQGARQALDAQLLAGGVMNQEQLDALTHATDIGMSQFGAGMSILQGNIFAGLDILAGTEGTTAYQQQYVERKAQESGLAASQLNDEDRKKLVSEAKMAQDAASEMFANGLNEDLKIMVAAGKIAGDQAAALGAELMNNSLSAAAKQYQIKQKQGKSILGLDQALFMQNIESGVIGELDKIQEQKIINIGLNYSESGGNLQELTTTINNLPEEKRIDFIANLPENISPQMLDTLMGMSAEAATTKVATFATKFQGNAVAPEGRRGRSAARYVNIENAKQEEAVRKQAEEYGSLLDNISEMAGTEAAMAIDTYLNFNGKEEDLPRVIEGIQEFKTNVENLTNLPQDLSIRLNVDMLDPQEIARLGPMADVLNKNWPILQNLNKNLDLKMYAEFLTIGANGEELSPKDIAKNTMELNKLWKDFAKAKNIEARKTAYLKIIRLRDGNEVSEEDYGQMWDDLIAEFGEQKIANLPADSINKLFNLNFAIEADKKQLAILKEARRDLLKAGASAEELAKIDAAISALEIATGQKAAQRENIVNFGSKRPKSDSGGGEKSIIQQLKDQLKNLQGIYEGFAKNISAKTGLFKETMAGPFGKEFIDYLISQGEKGIKILKEKGEKFNQAYKIFLAAQMQASKNVQQQLPSMFNQQRLQVTGESLIEQELLGKNFSEENIKTYLDAMPEGFAAAYASARAAKEKNKRRIAQGKKRIPLTEEQKTILSDVENLSPKSIKQANRLNATMREEFIQSKEDAEDLQVAISDALGGKDISPEVIDMLVEMGWTANQARSNVNQLASEAQRLDQIVTAAKYRESMAGMTEETNNLNYALELMSQGYAPDVAQAISQIGNASTLSAQDVANFAKSYENIEVLKLAIQGKDAIALQTLEGQNRIDQLKYEKELIESINDDEKMAALYIKEGVSNHEDLLQVYQRQADIKSREIELKQREFEPIDEEINRLEEQKSKIEESYDKRLEALDEIFNKEQEIFAIRERTLDVADALSRGDIAAAAKAALELEKERASQRADDQRSSLEKQRAAEIELIDKKINDQKEKRKVIENEIKRLQLEQRAIQDTIYNVQFIISEQAARLEDKYKLGNNQLELINLQLKQAEENQKRLNAAAAKFNPGGATGGDAGNSAGGGSSTPTLPAGIISQSDTRWDTKDKRLKYTFSGYTVTGKVQTGNGQWAEYLNGRKTGKVGTYMYGGMVKYKGSTEAAPGMMYGGKIKKFAAGNYVAGSGMLDSVPALLTPGEFVVRKPVAQAYGPLLESINSKVFPRMNFGGAMPRSSPTTTGTTNSYNVSVTLNGANMNPDDVANAVMRKIKTQENMKVRSYNYNG